MPVTPVTVLDDVNGDPSSVSVSPGTLERIVIDAVRGRRSRVVVWVSPFESLTVRYIRYHTSAENSPVVGMVNEPEREPLVGWMKGWVWSAWWKSTRQVKALAGSVPSSASEPVPE